MGKINIPLNYPNGCNEEEVKEVMENCHKYIAGQSKAANVVITPPYYKTIIELGNAHLNRKSNEELIKNLKTSSKRQQNLTTAIIIIGGLNFLYSLLNSLGCI